MIATLRLTWYERDSFDISIISRFMKYFLLFMAAYESYALIRRFEKTDFDALARGIDE